MGRYPTYSKSGISRARKLRRSFTEAERKLCAILRHNQLGVRFRRQVPVGLYVVDFLSNKVKLIIEVDGSQHLQDKNQRDDRVREDYLKQQGYKVMRFNNIEVPQDSNLVLQTIFDYVQKY